MLKIVGQKDSLILFENSGQAVTVCTKSFNVSPAASLASYGPLDTWKSVTAPLASVYSELASTGFILNSEPTTTNRTYRVPKAVLADVQANLPEDAALLASARTLLTGTINTEAVKNLRPHFSQIAGEATTSWVGRIISSLVAAGELEPSLEPHPFELDPAVSEPTCKVCGLPLEDLIHIAPGEDAEGSNKFFALFNEEGLVDAMFAQDSSGAYWQRDLGVWAPAEAPEQTFNLVPLDTDSVLSLRSQIDDASNLPGTYELSISEDRLFQLAAPELDLDLYARVFETIPYVDPAIRSANAKAQSRDSNGKFIKMGARLTTPSGESAKVIDEMPGSDLVKVQKDSGEEELVTAADTQVESSEPKAVLKEPLEPVENLNVLLDEYLKEASPESSEEFAIVVGEGPEETTPSGGGSVLALPVPESSGSESGGETARQPISPLYLAVVDSEDLQAVVELVAIIPDEAGTGLEAYTRDEGTWAPAPEMLADLRGTTPPPVVELESDTLDDVITQIDGKTMQASAYAGVVCYTLARNDAGELIATRGTTPILASYSDTGEFPLDVFETLEQLFAAEGGTDRNRGNAERLRRYWTTGPGGAKINWANDEGNWSRCVKFLTPHLGERAKGYCQLRHKEMTGHYTGSERRS